MPTDSHPDFAYVPRVRSLEDRRKRGEVACAECRRLKLKCDRTIPCRSCIKRGCRELCPNESQNTKDGTRVVFAATEHLHNELATIRNRSRLLAAAISSMRDGRAAGPHPLLVHSADSEDEEEEDAALATLSRGMSSLTVIDDGSTRFFGNVASSSGVTSSVDTTDLSGFPPLLTRLYSTFPFPPSKLANSQDTIKQLLECLPTQSQTEELCESFLEHMGYIFPGVSRPLVMGEIIPRIYGHSVPYPSHDIDREEPHSPGSLALVFALLGLGILLQAKEPHRHKMAAAYEKVGLAALGAANVFNRPRYVSVLALFMQAMLELIQQRGMGDRGRSLMFMACRLGSQIGLHTDGSGFKLPFVVTQRRHALYWMMYQTDTWECLTVGRPPYYSHVDGFEGCPCPFDETTEHLPEGPRPLSNATFLYARNVAMEVVLHVQAMAPPPYSQTIALDMKIRAISGGPPSTPLDSLRGLKRAWYKSPRTATMLIYLHRGHFVQAILDSPEDPLRSKYTVSFQATVRAAREILDWIGYFYQSDPERAVFFPHEWTRAFNAALVYATLISEAPSSAYAKLALDRLKQACELFDQARQRQCGRAAYALPILQGIYTKASNAMLNRSKVKEELDGGAMGEFIGTKNGKLALMRGSQSPPSSPILSATVTDIDLSDALEFAPFDEKLRAASGVAKSFDDLFIGRFRGPLAHANAGIPLELELLPSGSGSSSLNTNTHSSSSFKAPLAPIAFDIQIPALLPDVLQPYGRDRSMSIDSHWQYHVSEFGL